MNLCVANNQGEFNDRHGKDTNKIRESHSFDGYIFIWRELSQPPVLLWAGTLALAVHRMAMCAPQAGCHGALIQPFWGV